MKLFIICCLLFPAGLHAQPLKPETAQQFDCYVQSAEARMDARKAFLLADTNTALNEQIVRGQKIQTMEARPGWPGCMRSAWTPSPARPPGRARMSRCSSPTPRGRA